MNDKAIVTITLGAKHRGLWKAHCERNWLAYADRHGYDVICIDEPLDSSPRAARRSPTWQKCLILGQPFAERYDQIVWIDSDVAINPVAPSLVAGVPKDRIGAVDEYSTPTREAYREALRKLYRHWEATGASFERNETARDFYAAYGFPHGHDRVVQAGVLVLSPPHHRALLEKIYAYEERGGDLWGEWRPLSFELLEADAVAWLDHRFNYPWLIYKAQHFAYLLNNPAHERAKDAATAALQDVFCLHFAGAHDEIALAGSTPTGPRRREQRQAPARAARPLQPLRTPVALLLFARPDTTKRLLATVRAARPERLLVIADTAPPGDSLRAALCAEVRELVEAIDWDCEVDTNFAENHMGLNRRVETGLDWVFDTVDEAIVLEDDCIPHPTFFRFCEESLAKHRDDERVTSISGDNFLGDAAADGDSFFYSRYPLIWGWATWRRAWRAHDPRMSRWPGLRADGWIGDLFGDDRHAVAYWSHHFDKTYGGEGSWDYAWTFTSWLKGGLTVIPDVNLVANVGFRADATHTRHDDYSPFANLPTRAIQSPLRHPAEVTRDLEHDRFLEDVLFSGNLRRLFDRLRRKRRLGQPAVQGH